MHAVLKKLESSKIQDLNNYQPKDYQNFSVALKVLVGFYGHQGEEIFYVDVCTPQWLLSNHSKEDIVIGRHLVLVAEYDFSRIREKIRRSIEACSGESWEEIIRKVSRIGIWEHEEPINFR